MIFWGIFKCFVFLFTWFPLVIFSFIELFLVVRYIWSFWYFQCCYAIFGLIVTFCFLGHLISCSLFFWQFEIVGFLGVNFKCLNLLKLFLCYFWAPFKLLFCWLFDFLYLFLLLGGKFRFFKTVFMIFLGSF